MAPSTLWSKNGLVACVALVASPLMADQPDYTPGSTSSPDPSVAARPANRLRSEHRMRLAAAPQADGPAATPVAASPTPYTNAPAPTQPGRPIRVGELPREAWPIYPDTGLADPAIALQGPELDAADPPPTVETEAVPAAPLEDADSASSQPPRADAAEIDNAAATPVTTEPEPVSEWTPSFADPAAPAEMTPDQRIAHGFHPDVWRFPPFTPESSEPHIPIVEDESPDSPVRHRWGQTAPQSPAVSVSAETVEHAPSVEEVVETLESSLATPDVATDEANPLRGPTPTERESAGLGDEQSVLVASADPSPPASASADDAYPATPHADLRRLEWGSAEKQPATTPEPQDVYTLGAVTSAGQDVEEADQVSPAPAPIGSPDVSDSQAPRVEFAQRAIRFSAPNEWRMDEHPYRREVRLELRPAEGDKQVGIWVTYHVRPRTSVASAEQLLRDRLRDEMPTVVLSPPRALRVSDRQGVLLTYANGDDENPLQGWRSMIAAGWGFVEVNAFATPEDWPETALVARRLFESIAISDPQPRPQSPRPDVRDASAILGAWKAYRSRMYLSANGRIVIEHDRIIPASLQQRFQTETLPTQRRLAGRFVAENDVLRVVWDDESQLNYRWKIRNGRLLLTDHDGLVSQLHRLLEDTDAAASPLGE